RRLDGERVRVAEGRRLEQREAALLLERLGAPVRLPGRAWPAAVTGDLREQDPGVFGVHVEAARGQSLVDDLRAADVALQHHAEARAAQRSCVELAEDVLLGEVLRADRDR